MSTATSERVLRAELEVEVRSIDREKRQATFVASTERAVPMWDGPEVLRAAGVDLKRFKRNPVLLDSHDRSTIEAVLGSAEVWVEGRKLLSRNTYATTPRGEIAWQLVQAGHVRAMSIGYLPDPAKVKRLLAGETDGREEDGSLVTGPATVVNRWTLTEVSNVPIPADQDAVRRAFYDGLPNATPEDPMAATSQTLTDAMTAALRAAGVTATTPPAPAPGASTAPPPPPHTVPAPAQVPSPASATGAERADAPTVLEARRRDILAITPPGLEGVAHESIMRGHDVETARKALVDAWTKRHAPGGTPDAPTPPPAPGTRAGAPDLATVKDEDLVRSFQTIG